MRGIFVTPSSFVQIVTVQSRKGEIGKWCRDSLDDSGCPREAKVTEAEISPHIRKLAYTDIVPSLLPTRIHARVLVYALFASSHRDIYRYIRESGAWSFREPAGRTGEEKVLS